MAWIKLTGVDGTPALINLDLVDYIDTGYSEWGCNVFFRSGKVRNVQETIEVVREQFKNAF